jgi:tetratricopeptide (TPR) repeat protein
MCEGLALCELNRFDDADHALAIGVARFPENSEIFGNFARVAHRRSDWPVAVARWEAVRQRFFDDDVGYSSGGVALLEMQRFDEADALLSAAIVRFPQSAEILANYAWVAYRRRHWQEALVRWTLYRDRFPADSLGNYQVIHILGELGRNEDADSLAASSHENQSASDTAAVMIRFESLGDHCEFGTVQRHFHAEPLGLLKIHRHSTSGADLGS